MGIVHVNVAISNPADPDRGEHLELLVDTGATLSVVPRRVLERLAVSPIGRRDFRGFGGVISRETGIVSMTYDGATAGVTVVFGEEDDPPILGVTALESLGYQVDPVSGELKPSEMLLL
jgi:predicted aspartyl protease